MVDYYSQYSPLAWELWLFHPPVRSCELQWRSAIRVLHIHYFMSPYKINRKIVLSRQWKNITFYSTRMRPTLTRCVVYGLCGIDQKSSTWNPVQLSDLAERLSPGRHFCCALSNSSMVLFKKKPRDVNENRATPVTSQIWTVQRPQECSSWSSYQPQSVNTGTETQLSRLMLMTEWKKGRMHLQ